MRISDWSSDVCSSDLAEVNRLVDQQQSEWQRLHRLLAAQGIVVHGAGSDAEALRAALRPYFLDQIFPILTPQVLDPAHPFPFIPNRGLGVIFDLQRKATGDQIGRASCRERVCQSVSLSVVADSLQTNNTI